MREGRSKIFEERGLEGGIMGRGGSWSTRTEVEEEDVAGGGRYTKRKVVTHDFRRLLRTGYSDSLRSHSGSGYSQSNVTIEVTLARIGRRGQMTSRKSNDEEAKRIKDFQVASPGATRQGMRDVWICFLTRYAPRLKNWTLLRVSALFCFLGVGGFLRRRYECTFDAMGVI
jgi:hypothetical protein